MSGREEREVNEETRTAVSSLLALISREYSDSLFGPPHYVMGSMYEIPGQLTQKTPQTFQLPWFHHETVSGLVSLFHGLTLVFLIKPVTSD